MSAARHPRQPALLATVFLLNGAEFLQSGMIAFGANAIMGQINASADQFVLATVLYAAVAMTAIAAQHWLVERLGWRAYIQISSAMFVTGAIICSASDSLASFMVGRATMACGGAGFMTAARLLINLIPPSPQRMKGIAAFGSALALGNALAPWAAACVIDADHVAWLFAVPSAMAVLAAVLAAICLPQDLAADSERSASSPWLAAAILSTSLLALYGVQRAAFDFYDDVTPLLACVAVAVAGIVMVVRHQSRQARPMLAFGRLAQKRYLAGLALFAFCYVILGANNATLPLLLQRSLNAPWQAVGAVQTIGLLSSVLAFAATIAVLKRWPSPRKFYVVGFAFLFLFAWQLSRLTAEADLWRDVLPAIAAFGVFLILVLATTAIHTFTGLQHDAVGFNHGQMLKNMMSQFGLALGVAGSTVAMQWRISDHYTILRERFSGGDAVFTALRDQLGGAVGMPQAIAQLAQMLGQQANLLAGLEYFSVLMVVAALAALLMLTQRVFR